MWPFKKQGETLDLTILHKRGLLKVPEEKPDLGPAQQKAINQPIPTDSSIPVTDSSAMSFLGDMASSAESSSSNPASGSFSKNYGGLSANKIDDLEYKMDSLSRRLSSILDRLDLAEKKIDRLERR